MDLPRVKISAQLLVFRVMQMEWCKVGLTTLSNSLWISRDVYTIFSMVLHAVFSQEDGKFSSYICHISFIVLNLNNCHAISMPDSNVSQIKSRSRNKYSHSINKQFAKDTRTQSGHSHIIKIKKQLFFLTNYNLCESNICHEALQHIPQNFNTKCRALQCPPQKTRVVCLQTAVISFKR